ncbi:unnamed protein product [Paramecium sonneborni]|uniref:Uncharacterized protein n=1 Tax=Paramecium sonneborni TaxID=65129 RepID=A0A8S1LR28_9CILI|nr:unnamed protein product [Paramecium sonneborni]
MNQYECQQDQHNNLTCSYICIEPFCKLKRISCFQCFQDKDSHESHQGLAIDEFQQKVKFRLQNLNQLKDALDLTKTLFNQFINNQIEFIRNHILEGKKYLDDNNLYKIRFINDYFISEQDNRAPYVQEQLFKIRKKIKRINEFISNIKCMDTKLVTKEINDIKIKAMDCIKRKYVGHYKDAIQILNKGLKEIPTCCSLISLKCTCLININKIDSAQRLINYAFQINCYDETVLLLLAKFMYLKNQYGKCLEICELSFEPNQYLAYFKLDSLKQLQETQKMLAFQKECEKKFGYQFYEQYLKHQNIKH